jgi:hypothetical protein
MLNAIVIIITTKITLCIQFYFNVIPISFEYFTRDIHICGHSHALDGLVSVHIVRVAIVGNLQVSDTNQFNPGSMLDDRKSKPRR